MRIKKVEKIFNVAITLPTQQEQSAYIKGACADDDELRKQVELLLLSHDKMGDFLPTDPGVPAITLPDRPLSEGEGTVVGRYKLLQKIGEGGMGVVYMAEQTEPLVRKVALKIIKLGMDTKSIIARFEAERQALAMMDHPNIARVLDAGSTDSGRPFFVMELVQGLSITEYGDRNRLTAQDRLELFIPVCDAIQHAHLKGVIHRDIKPSNVMITLHDGNPVPKVIDFGIAKATNQKLTENTLFTHYAQMIGTPAYMSPEQAEMSGLDIDTRSDVYSAGVLLYELLTGSTPIPAKRLLSLGYGEMQRVISEEDPPKPSTRLSSIDQGQRTIIANNRSTKENALSNRLAGDIDWIVMKAIDKDRTRRYATVSALAQDIRHHLDDEPVTAAAPSLLYRLKKLYSRYRLFLRMAAAIAVLIVIGLVISTLQTIRIHGLNTSLAEELTTSDRLRRQADAARVTAENARESEKQLRLETEESELYARRVAYAADIALAQAKLEEGNLGDVRKLLAAHIPDEGQEDFRDWEWRYLWQFCHGDEMANLLHASGAIDKIALSHDARWLITKAEVGGRRISLWDLDREAFVSDLAKDGEIPRGSFAAGARPEFAPNKPYCAILFNSPSGSDARFEIRIVDVASQSIVTRIPTNEQLVGFRFSTDSSRLLGFATDFNQATASVWRLADGVLLSQAEGPPYRPIDHDTGKPFAISADLNRVFYVETDFSSAVCLDIAENKILWKTTVSDEYVLSMELSLDGQTLAVGQGLVASKISLLNATSGARLGVLDAHRAGVNRLHFIDNDQTLVSASIDQHLILWDLALLQARRVLNGHEHHVSDCLIVPGSDRIISAGKDGAVKLWNSVDRGPSTAYRRLEGNLNHWAFSADSKSIYGIPFGEDSFWRFDGSAPERKELMPAINDLFDDRRLIWAFNWRGKSLLAVGSDHGEISIYDFETAARLHRAKTGDQRIIPVGFDGYAHLILAEAVHPLSTSKRVPLQIWRLSERFENIGQTFGGELVALAPPRFDPKDWHIRQRHPRHRKLILDTNLLNSTNSFRQEFPDANGFHFSPDGTLLAIAEDSGRMTLWTRPTPQTGPTLVGNLSGNLYQFNHPRFSPNGNRLAVGSGGRESVTLWDVVTMRKLINLESPGTVGSGPEFGPRFSPDGNRLAIQSSSGNVSLWHAPSFEEITQNMENDRLRSTPRIQRPSAPQE